MTRYAKQFLVQKAVLEDALVFEWFVARELDELVAEAKARGDVVVEADSQVIPPAPWCAREQVPNRRRRWWHWFMPDRWREPRLVWVDAPVTLLLSVRVLEVVRREERVTWTAIADSGHEALRAACQPHAEHAGGVFEGMVDAGGYSELSCKEHGLVWTRAGDFGG